MGPGFPFDNVSLIRIVFGFVVLGLIGLVWRGRQRSLSIVTTMVLQTFRVSEDPTAAVGIEIRGRASGILSWILTLIRLQDDQEFLLTDTDVSVRWASLSGFQHEYVPLGKVHGTLCGYQRSIWALIFTLLFAIGFVFYLLVGLFETNRQDVGADMGMAFGMLVLAAIGAAFYFFSKRIILLVHNGHKYLGVAFKRSLIENVSVDLPEALHAVEVINARVLEAQGGRAPLAAAAAAASAGGTVNVSSPQRRPGQCRDCSTVNPSGTRFCENCGASLSS